VFQLLRHQLVDTNPDAYLPDLALTLNNLATLHGTLKKHKQAEKEYAEALAIYRSLGLF